MTTEDLIKEIKEWLGDYGCNQASQIAEACGCGCCDEYECDFCTEQAPTPDRIVHRDNCIVALAQELVKTYYNHNRSPFDND